MPLEILTLKTTGDKNPGAVTVKLTGSLDTATAPDLERHLAPLLLQIVFHRVAEIRIGDVVRRVGGLR